MEVITVKKTLLYSLAIFMVVAGINHFLNPNFYYPLIPEYLSFPKIINFTSGFFEIILGAFLLIEKWRYYAALGIILLLVLFIPSHVYFIQMGSCVPDGLCTPEWVAWLRLLVIHPLLMYWAWLLRN